MLLTYKHRLLVHRGLIVSLSLKFCAGPFDGYRAGRATNGRTSSPFETQVFLAEECVHSLFHVFRGSCLAFPDHEGVPARRFEGFDVFPAACFVPLKFRHPIVPIGLGYVCDLAVV